MKPKKRRLAFAVVFVLVALGAWALASELRPEGGSWARVERRDLVVGVEVEGELQAVDSEPIGPPQLRDVWDFKIAWMAPEGAEIQVGQPVLRFDTTQLQQQLQQQVTERDSKQKSLEKKETDLEIERRGMELSRAEAEGRLRKAGLQLEVPAAATARAELDKARIDQDLAKLEIASVKSKLAHLEERSRADIKAFRDARDRAAALVARLESDIESMTVKAPRAGTLIYVSNWRGEKKKVGDSTWRAEKVMEIPDLTRMQAMGEVAESDVGRLAVGQAVTLRLDAHPDQQYAGRVKSIRRAVQTKSRRDPKKIVRLEVALDSTDTERMRPGMRFRGEVEVERIAGTLVVPHEAVFPRPGGAVVYVRTLGGKREVAPEFGARSLEEFGVVDGLGEGDWVLRREEGKGR
jgi:hypothetical protein